VTEFELFVAVLVLQCRTRNNRCHENVTTTLRAAPKVGVFSRLLRGGVAPSGSGDLVSDRVVLPGGTAPRGCHCGGGFQLVRRSVGRFPRSTTPCFLLFAYSPRPTQFPCTGRIGERSEGLFMSTQEQVGVRVSAPPT